MDSGRLTPQQLDVLIAAISRQVVYLYRLKGRMLQSGFPTDDPLFALTLAAESAANALHSELLTLRVSIKERRPRARKQD